MPTLTPINELPRPLGNETFTRAHYLDLIDALELAIRSAAPMTTAQRNALPSARLWVGRLIYNTTAGEYQRCTAVAPDPGGAWTNDIAAIYALDTDLATEITNRTNADTAETAARIAADAAHVAAADPHSQYALDTDLATHSGGINGAPAHVRQLADGKVNADAPSTYATGFSSANVTAANGFPVDGTLVTFRHAAGRTLQRLEGYAAAAADPVLYERFGLTGDAGWGTWQRIARANEIPATPTSVDKTDSATTADWVARIRRTADTQYRAVLEDAGLLLGPGGSTAPDVLLKRDATTRGRFRNAADSADADLFVGNLLMAQLQHGADTTRSLRWGSGSPEGVITASVGSVYYRTDGAAGTVQYNKETGNATNTGWKAMSASSSGKVLASVLYDPGTRVTVSLSATAAMVAFDTTNLRLGFTVPASGKVRVRASVPGEYGTATPPKIMLGILEGSTVRMRLNPKGPTGAGSGATASLNHSNEIEGVVSGLTPGASLNWDLAYGIETGGTDTLKYGGPNDATGLNANGAVAFEILEA